MVNNSTNINKTNNHLSPKESLNSNGQQFYQHQQKQNKVWIKKRYLACLYIKDEHETNNTVFIAFLMKHYLSPLVFSLLLVIIKPKNDIYQ
jgi:predicted protein tyrosine phosphatase